MLPAPGPDDSHRYQDGDRGKTDQAGAANQPLEPLPAVAKRVANQANGDRPHHRAAGIVEKKDAPRQLAGTGEKGTKDAEPGDEPRDENGLGAVAGEKAVKQLEPVPCQPDAPPVPLRDASSGTPSNQKSKIVAEDGRHDGGGDDAGQPEAAEVRERRARQQRGLTRHRHAGIFQEHTREDDVRTALKHPLVGVGTDSSAKAEDGKLAESKSHPRAWGSFPRILGRFVRDERLLTIEEAIRKMTSKAAARVHLRDRGVLRPGMMADITVFDAATIRDLATFENPNRYSTGVKHVFVNGRRVVADGKITPERPGRPLRGSAAR